AGAAAVALAAEELEPAAVLLIQPVLDIAAHVVSIRRSAKRATLGATPPDCAFGFALPDTLPEGASVEAAHAGLRRVRGRKAIIHYPGSAPDHVPPDAEVLPVKGRWAMAPGLDFAPLADASLDWLRPAVKELA